MFNIENGYPFSGEKLGEMVAFLSKNGIRYEYDALYSVILRESQGGIVAAGSLGSGILKYIAVDDAYRGDGVLSQIITCLIEEAAARSFRRLFLYTKPENRQIFTSYGFYPVVATDEMLFMENRRDGFERYIDAVRAQSPACTGRIGAVVCNCDPFTLGHQYLIRRAAAECSLIHVFVLSAEKSRFPAALRYAMVVEGTKEFANVVVHSTDDYLISAATMPAYFIKDSHGAEEACFRLDITLFCRRVVPALGINARYVGTEPYSPVTLAYNLALRKALPEYGIELVEIPRLESEGVAISASRAREMLSQSSPESLEELLPPSTLRLLAQAQI